LTTEVINRKPANYKGTGRPTKLTPKLQETICSIIAQGNYLKTACEFVGIGKSTYLLWLERAEEEASNGGGIYLDFMLAIKRAEAQAETERVARIKLAGIGGQVAKRITRIKKDGTEEIEESYQLPQWLADMTHLERRHPDHWGRKDRIQGGGNMYNINIEKALIDAAGKLEEEIEQLAARRQLPEVIPSQLVERGKWEEE